MAGTRALSRATSLLLLLAIASHLGLGLTSCSSADSDPAEIWTSVPEIALAAELFNSTQDRFLVEVAWKADLIGEIRTAKSLPSLVIGPFLKSSASRDRFMNLKTLDIDTSAIYPGLLELGNIEGRQLLLPLSFDLPAIVFARGSPPVKDEFLVGIEDMAAPATAFNRKEKGYLARMGFSPRWDPDFLTLLVSAGGAAFKEGRPLDWDDAGLREAVESVRTWIRSVNGAASQDDDFQFKYLYTPAYQYVASKRVLFSYLEASSFFLVPDDKRAALDFRWFAVKGSVPVLENMANVAMPKGGRGRRAAEAFLSWLYREESQRALLERSRRTRTLEGSFGIAGGFSAIRSVNEKIFPLFYPTLLGHMPPADSLITSGILPSEWPQLKAEVVAPWLLQVTAEAPGTAFDPTQVLNARIAEYRKKAAK
jgi:ABC-type glycerol-3-phosphate transport system substrate-binding protein